VNKLVTMSDAAQLLGMTGPDLVRRTRRRLRAIAEDRGGVQLFRLGERAWYTTLEDIRRVLPELFTYDDGDTLRSLVERQAVELRALRQKVEAIENAQWAKRNQT
jgi:hypothetical protein